MAFFPFKTRAADPPAVVFANALSAGWTNWSWGSNVDFGNVITFTPGPWGGLYLHTDNSLDPADFASLDFSLKATRDNQNFRVIVYNADNQAIGSSTIPDGAPLSVDNWRDYSIPLQNLDPDKKPVKGIAIQEISGQAQPAIYFNKIQFAAAPSGGNSALNIFNSALASGWTSWSWDSQINFGPVIAYQSFHQWSGIYLHNETGVNLQSYSYLHFSAKAGKPGQKFAAIIYDANNSPAGNSLPLTNYGGDPGADNWQDYQIPLSDLGATGKTIKGVALQDIGPVQDTLYLNDLAFTSLPLTDNQQAAANISVTPTPQPAPPTSLTDSGGFNTGNGAIYRNGQKINLHGINWFGFETDAHVVHGLWARNYKDIISQIKNLGFNAVRLPFCPASIQGASTSSIDFVKNPDLNGLNSLQVLDKIVTEMDNQGLFTLLDSHRPDCNTQSELWYTDTYPESQWINDLKTLAGRFANLTNFLGLDLKNEPHGAATWGTGNISTDWNLAAERAGSTVLSVNPHILLFVEGIGDNPNCQDNNAHFWGGNLAPVKCKGLNLPGNKVVYSPHVYGPDVSWQSYFGESGFPNNMPAIWDAQWGYLAGSYALAPGEWGGKYGNNGGNPLDVTWQNAFVGYLINKKICSSFYWDLNPNSGDTGGVLQDDWTTPWSDKLSLLQNYFNSCQ